MTAIKQAEPAVVGAGVHGHRFDAEGAIYFLRSLLVAVAVASSLCLAVIAYLPVDVMRGAVILNGGHVRR